MIKKPDKPVDRDDLADVAKVLRATARRIEDDAESQELVEVFASYDVHDEGSTLTESRGGWVTLKEADRIMRVLECLLPNGGRG